MRFGCVLQESNDCELSTPSLLSVQRLQTCNQCPRFYPWLGDSKGTNPETSSWKVTNVSRLIWQDNYKGIVFDNEFIKWCLNQNPVWNVNFLLEEILIKLRARTYKPTICIMHTACILFLGDNSVSCILTQFSPLVVMRRNLNMNGNQGGINLGCPAGSVSSNLSMLTMIRFDLGLSFCFDRLLVTVLIML